MLDVLLVAVLVAWMKMGDLVEFSVGPGLWVFAAVVLLSLTASAQYDAHALWEDPESP
jgi:paraquat-inducible protein A